MKRILVFLVACLSAIMLIAGCGTSNNSSGKHLNVALFWFGDTVNPANEWDGWTTSRIGAGETLIIVNDKMEFVGQLADKLENVAPTTWKLHTRKGVKFQNGDDMTPEEVKASLEWIMKTNERTSTASKIKDITVDGENLVITTTEPYWCIGFRTTCRYSEYGLFQK